MNFCFLFKNKISSVGDGNLELYTLPLAQNEFRIEEDPMTVSRVESAK